MASTAATSSAAATAGAGEGSAASSSGNDHGNAGQASSSPSGLPYSKPVICLVVGMAGSGKSTMVQRLAVDAYERNDSYYVVNLDPAVMNVGYEADVDIRDTVKYDQVMKQFKLGPNGAIMTSLNLFATHFDQLMKHIEARRDELDYVFVDTPGQIEVFTWSASGSIISDAFASTFPTCLLYVVDTPRCNAPSTFMANMTYACSIMYKAQLPFVLLFNKTDIASAQKAMDWVQDVDAYIDALQTEQSYSSDLSRSLALMLDSFYRTLQCVPLSATTGEGTQAVAQAVAACKKKYFEVYRVELVKRQANAAAREARRKQDQQEAFKRQLHEDKGHRVVPFQQDGEDSEDDEEED